jgi:hypothetical protein
METEVVVVVVVAAELYQCCHDMVDDSCNYVDLLACCITRLSVCLH